VVFFENTDTLAPYKGCNFPESKVTTYFFTFKKTFVNAQREKDE
jgi:hypothetical protein